MPCGLFLSSRLKTSAACSAALMFSFESHACLRSKLWSSLKKKALLIVTRQLNNGFLLVSSRFTGHWVLLLCHSKAFTTIEFKSSPTLNVLAGGGTSIVGLEGFVS